MGRSEARGMSADAKRQSALDHLSEVADLWKASQDAQDEAFRCRRELIDGLRAATRAGHTQTEISRHLGMSRQRISALFNDPS